MIAAAFSVVLLAAGAAPSTENWPTPPVTTTTVTARRAVSYEVLVLEKRTVLFAAPDHTSHALRLCPPGEILPISAELDADGETWLETPFDATRAGYVRQKKVSAPGDLQREDWQPPYALRDHRPFGVAAVAWDKTFGYGVQFRYALMSRFGLGFTIGAALDRRGRVHGGNWALGLNSFFVIWNLSPYAEAGVSSLYYDARRSLLRVWSFYATLGLEWMFDFGLFVAVHASYLVAFDRGVSYAIESYARGGLGTDTYGPFDLPASEPMQFLRPGGTIGFVF